MKLITETCLQKIAEYIKINKRKVKETTDCKLLRITMHINTKATPAGTSWIYVLLFCYHSFVSCSLARMPGGSINAYMHWALGSCLCLTLPALKVLLHAQNSNVFKLQRTSGMSSDGDSRQCATCIIKAFYHIIFWIFLFETLLWAIMLVP
jgi:hypothetical protein